MKLLALIITLYLAIPVEAQPVQKIKQLLKDRNLAALNSYVNNHPKSDVDFYWHVLRGIVGGYQEGVIEIKEYVRSTDSAGGSYTNNYTINLLTANGKIFYYSFIKFDYKKKGNDEWVLYTETRRIIVCRVFS